MQQQFLDTGKPKKTDLDLVIAYVILSVVLFALTVFNPTYQFNRNIVAGYSIVTDLSIYSIFYRGLRNRSLFLIWTVIGISHLIYFFVMRYEYSLHYTRGFAGSPLLFSLLLIYLFEILRFLSRRIVKLELETIFFGGVSLFKERKLMWFDWVSCIIYSAVMIFAWS